MSERRSWLILRIFTACLSKNANAVACIGKSGVLRSGGLEIDPVRMDSELSITAFNRGRSI